jgi:valyl-tRNA synthetase
LHGKFVVHPFLDRKIPIITDGILVDKEFGTGAVKVTPSHDHNDYKCGIRHNLQFINIMNDDGTFNQNTGKYAGMRRYDVRYVIMKDLQELGLLRERVSNKMTLSICSRSVGQL